MTNPWTYTPGRIEQALIDVTAAARTGDLDQQTRTVAGLADHEVLKVIAALAESIVYRRRRADRPHHVALLLALAGTIASMPDTPVGAGAPSKPPPRPWWRSWRAS